MIAVRSAAAAAVAFNNSKRNAECHKNLPASAYALAFGAKCVSVSCWVAVSAAMTAAVSRTWLVSVCGTASMA
jgi:hypothetical protein